MMCVSHFRIHLKSITVELEIFSSFQLLTMFTFAYPLALASKDVYKEVRKRLEVPKIKLPG